MIQPSSARALTRRIWQVLFAAVLVVETTGCKKEAPTQKQPVVRPVRVQRVAPSGGAEQRTFAGTARAAAESRLSFKVAGTLERLTVKVGDRVKQGQFIASLDATDQSLQAQEAAAAVAQAEAQLRNAQASYERVRGLYETSNASQQDLDSARTGADLARAAVVAAKKRQQLAGSRAGDTRLVARSAGTIAQVNVEEGENVAPGQVVAVLNSDERIEVELAVPESVISRLKAGTPATVRFDAIKGVSFQAAISEVGVAAGQASTTYSVVVTLEKVDARVRSGMAASVTVRFGEEGDKQRLCVSPRAVGEDRSGRFVFLAKPSRAGFAKVHRRKVSVGELTEDGVELMQGVGEGDLVVTAGVRHLKEGMKVRLLQSATPRAAASTPQPAPTATASASAKGP